MFPCQPRRFPLIVIGTLSCTLLLLTSGCRKQEHAASNKGSEDKVLQAPGKKIQDLSLEEARNAYDYYLSVGKDEQRAKVIERIVVLSTEQDEIEKLLKEAGALKLKLELFEEAEAYFANYLTLFPGSKTADFMEAQLILAMYKQTLGASRDLSKVKATITRAKSFLNRFGAQNPHSVQTMALLKQCYLTLLEHEALQIAFYLNRYNHAALPEKSLIAARNRAMHAQTKELVPLEPGEVEQNQLDAAYQPLKSDSFLQLPLEDQYNKIQLYQTALETFIQKRQELVQEPHSALPFIRRFF